MHQNFALLFVLAVTGCGDPGGQPPLDAPPGSSPDAPPDAPPDEAGCPAATLCLKLHPVVPLGSFPHSRLIVTFYQLVDDIELPFQITLDRPFSAASPEIRIPLAEIAPPAPLDDYQLCNRTCLDLDDPQCDCPASAAKATTAYVFVVRDLDQSGSIEPAEVTESNIHGVGYMHLAAGDAAYPVPNALDILFVEGIVEGLAPYRIIDGDPFDKLGIPAPGTVFELDVCVPEDASCEQLRFPNLT